MINLIKSDKTNMTQDEMIAEIKASFAKERRKTAQMDALKLKESLKNFDI